MTPSRSVVTFACRTRPGPGLRKSDKDFEASPSLHIERTEINSRISLVCGMDLAHQQ